jgi:hypothetical protein
MREWRHLKMLKRAGRGHDPTGVKGTQPGELAVVCPACPQPDINLPENWETVSDDKQYVLLVVGSYQQITDNPPTDTYTYFIWQLTHASGSNGASFQAKRKILVWALAGRASWRIISTENTCGRRQIRKR